MTLLKEKLEAAMAAWEEPKGTKLFQPTNNVTRATFNMVRDNPGITRKEAVAKLSPMGYKDTSTSTLISQMIRQRLVREEGGMLYANFPEYTPLKAKFRRVIADKKPAKVKKVKRTYIKSSAESKEDAGIAALQSQATQTVDAIIKNLTVYQAKELRDALNNLFK
jgi:hypothetical protein